MRLQNHLEKSSYHLLDKVDAELQVNLATVGAPKRAPAHAFRRTSAALGPPRSDEWRERGGARLKVEEWTEDTDEWERWQQVHDDNWARSNRRRGARSHPYLPNGADGVQQLGVTATEAAFPKGSGKGKPMALNVAGPSAPVAAGVALEQSVTLSGQQCQVILDSVTRARMCAHACEAVAQRSLTAFRAEQAALGDLQDTLASWLQNHAA